MIGVLTHHWAKSDKVEEAKTLLDGNEQGPRLRAPPDFHLPGRPHQDIHTCYLGLKQDL